MVRLQSRRVGFSLLEILIASSILLVILGVLVFSMQASRLTYDKSDQQVDSLTRLRIASAKITRVVREAEFISTDGSSLVLAPFQRKADGSIEVNSLGFPIFAPQQTLRLQASGSLVFGDEFLLSLGENANLQFALSPDRLLECTISTGKDARRKSVKMELFLPVFR